MTRLLRLPAVFLWIHMDCDLHQMAALDCY